jgi:hypothetical protein
LLDEVPVEGGPLKIQGSCVVALASSKEEVLETLKKDIYARSDIWDMSKAGLNVIRNWNFADFQIDPDLSIQMCFPSSMIWL